MPMRIIGLAYRRKNGPREQARHPRYPLSDSEGEIITLI